MGVLKKLFADTAIYGLGSIVPRVFNFFLVPLHTRVFGPEAYGNITDAYGWMAILNVVLMFGMETAYLRFASKEEGKNENVFHSAQTIVFGITLSVLLTLLALYLNGTLTIDFGNRNLLLYMVLTLFIDAACALPFVRLRIMNRSRMFSFLKITNVVILVVLNLYFLTSKTASPELVFLANVAANAIYLIYFLPLLIRWRPKWSSELSPKMLGYAWPIMLTGLAGMTNEMFSRISIDNWLPKNFYDGQSADYVQGVFGACYKFAVLMSLLVQAFRMAAEPFFFKNAGEKNSPALFAHVNHVFTTVAAFFMVAVCFNLNWLKYFVDQAYWSGLNIVPFLLLGYLFLGIYFNMSVWFKVTDRTIWGTVITFFGAGVTIGLNFLLIPHLGIMGSALVTFLCYFSMTLFCYVVGQRYYPVPYTLIRDFFTVFAGFAVAESFLLWGPEDDLEVLISGFILTIVTATALWFIEKNKLVRKF